LFFFNTANELFGGYVGLSACRCTYKKEKIKWNEEAKIGNYKFHLIIPEAALVCARGAVSIKNIKKKTFRRLISNSDVDYYYYFLVFFLLLLFFNHFNFSPPSSRIKLQSHYLHHHHHHHLHYVGGGGCGGGGGGRARRRQDSVSRARTNRPRVEHFSPSKTR